MRPRRDGDDGPRQHKRQRSRHSGDDGNPEGTGRDAVTEKRTGNPAGRVTSSKQSANPMGHPGSVAATYTSR